MTSTQPKLWVKKLFDDGIELSPIICPKDVSDAHAVRAAEENQRILPGININVQVQTALLDSLGKLWKTSVEKQLDWPESEQDLAEQTGYLYHYQNGSYSYFDAMTLACLLVKLKPKRVLAFVDQYQYACFRDIIEHCSLNNTTCLFIEPDPDRLSRYAPLPEDSRHKILCGSLKSLPQTHFDQLECGDMLFVDTTHVAKAGSDVCRLFNQILPRLESNVWIHIHDVFWPFEYPHEWLQEGRSWNELYVLRAWLQFNHIFEIKLFLNYLWRFFEKDCKLLFPNSVKNVGGALWLMKK